MTGSTPRIDGKFQVTRATRTVSGSFSSTSAPVVVQIDANSSNDELRLRRSSSSGPEMG
jgi:hypothetical protein